MGAHLSAEEAARYRPHLLEILRLVDQSMEERAVPCGKLGGLPTSIQLVGRHFEDGLLLRAAYAFQQSVDWDAYTGVMPTASAVEAVTAG